MRGYLSPFAADEWNDKSWRKSHRGAADAIRASAFIWVSLFSNRTLDVIDWVKALGIDIVEICMEDPETIDVGAIRARR